MKNFFLIPIFVLTLFTLSSCEDDSLDPLPVKVNGQFMKLDIDINHKQMNLDHIDETYFGGVLSCPSSNVAKFELYVRRTNSSGELTGDYVPLMTISTFPYDLKITPAQLAQALGLQVSDLKRGDFFRFYGYSYDASGNVADYRSLASLVRTTRALEQGYRFNTDLSTTEFLDPDYNNRVIN